jgi:protein-L-isoaspartate(D-aspartate) O-methyltransferase
MQLRLRSHEQMRPGNASDGSRGHRPVSDGATTDAGHASGVDGLIGARVGLADQLRTSGWASPAVSAAFGTVPRHAFVPQVEAENAYQDVAIVVKSDAGGLPVSASTQPAIMAIMLGQLGLASGQRVLEIGTGTGYNAALIAEIIGDPSGVVTIDVEPDLIEPARANLAAAGYAGVKVVCGDGADGVPDQAPYDRIIVTGGAWDLSPQWLSQLRAGGRIVLPISVRGIQLAVAFQQAGDHWIGRAACRCRFIRMTGALAGPESLVPLGREPGLHAHAVDGPVPDADLLYEALSGPATERPAGLRTGSIPELADLDLWLTLTQSSLTRLFMMGRHEGRANQAQQRMARLMPLGGLARPGSSGALGVAAITGAGGLTHRGDFGVVVQGYGAGGSALAENLAEQAAVWDRLGRPGADSLELHAYPAGTLVKAPGGSVILDRPHFRLLAGWPAT